MTDVAFSREQFQESIDQLKKECFELSEKAEAMWDQLQKLDSAAESVNALKAEVDQVHGGYLGLLEEDFLRRLKYYPNLAFNLIKQETTKITGK